MLIERNELSQKQKYWLLHSCKVKFTKHIRVPVESMSSLLEPVGDCKIQQFMVDISLTVAGNRRIAALVLWWKRGVRMLFRALHGLL